MTTIINKTSRQVEVKVDVGDASPPKAKVLGPGESLNLGSYEGIARLDLSMQNVDSFDTVTLSDG